MIHSSRRLDLTSGFVSLRSIVAGLAASAVVTFAPLAWAVEYPCNEAGLDAALDAGGDATFACAAPTTIVATSQKTISSGTNLDGGGLLTLSGNDTFTTLIVGPEVTASIKNMTLEHGLTTGHGGVLRVQGKLTMTDTTLRYGAAELGGALVHVVGGASIDMERCTLSHTISNGNDDAVLIDGEVTLINSTISDVTRRGIVVQNGGKLTVDQSTIVSVGEPVVSLSEEDSVTVDHSLFVSMGPARAPAFDVVGTFVSLGHNLFAVDGKGGTPNPTDLVGVTPLLGPLADNGGATQTRALLACSPGINAGATEGGAATDQTGQSRTRQGARDIGAVESDHLPCLSIANVTQSEGNAGTTSATLTVSLSGRSTLPVSVEWSTVDGTATAGDDYRPGSGSLTFAPGTQSQAISVIIDGDTRREDDETVRVVLSSPTNAVVPAPEGLVTITNDDADVPDAGSSAPPSPDAGTSTTDSNPLNLPPDTTCACMVIGRDGPHAWLSAALGPVAIGLFGLRRRRSRR